MSKYLKDILEKPTIDFTKDITKLSTSDKMEYFNSLSEYIRENSECRQGYVSVESSGGLGEKMWGEAPFRIMMSGSPDGYIQFRSLSELTDSVRNVAIRLKNEGIKSFR